MQEYGKKIRAFYFIFVFTLTLGGCAEAPAEVKKEMLEIDRAREEQEALRQTITYVSPSELSKDAQEDFSVECGVFRFAGNVVIPECENVYLLELKVNNDILINIEKTVPIIMQYLGIEEMNWKTYITDERGLSESKKNEGGKEATYGPSGFCDLEINDTVISVHQSGWMSIYRVPKDENHPHYLRGDPQILNTFFINNNLDTFLAREVELNGETVKLDELYDIFESAVNLMNTCSPGLNVVLHDAMVVEDRETKNQMIVLRALNNYQGVSMDSNYIYPQESRLTGGKSFVGFEMSQQIHFVGDTCKFALRETSHVVTEEKKEYDKVIDFNSALHLIEEAVPQDKITTIESAEFMYQIFYEGEGGQVWQYVYENPPIFYATPVWKFVEKERPDERSVTVYYVNAVTGEVYSFYQACTA